MAGKMIEAAAEANDELMDKFFDDGELSEEQIRAGLAAANAGGRHRALHVRIRFQE